MRGFNYPHSSYIASKADISRLGLKTVFTSNSFAAYRISTFIELEGFPDSTILSEDMFFAAKSVMAGYSVAYVSDAIVRHSHNYSTLEEFKDISILVFSKLMNHGLNKTLVVQVEKGKIPFI
jgi:rhamnosyltransferase